ncbi:O-antigen ligase family protein [Butyrivibrio sp. WCD2001]|uniref:O-antigen ligase family protein n=1 Tax=Butyrivibrio sp. WCD2001 TaxID=1280681 RepID=UPI0012DFE332|nr:O-antigen ligase family protein [Butyrivibrio sp. WCD2001]
MFFAGYFLLRIISNIYYITTYSQPIKTIFLIIFEQLGLIIGLYLVDPAKRDFIKIIKCIVWPATILFFIGINESFSYFRPFDYLYTVSRDILNDHYIRLGLLRATTTMGLPGFFGNMCVLVFPLILFLYHVTKKLIYVCISPLNILAIIHSGSRSDMIFIAFIIILYSIVRLFDKSERKSFIKHFLCISNFLLLFILLMCQTPRIKYYYEGTAKSLLNEAGFNYDLNEDSPDSTVGYGGNSTGGVLSRSSQFSGIGYALSKNPLFGLGSGAQMRKEVMYKWQGHWYNYSTIDVGLVEIFVSEGIIGFLAYCILIFFWFFIMLKCLKVSKTTSTYTFSLILPSYLLCTLSTINMPSFLMLYIYLSLVLLKQLKE